MPGAEGYERTRHRERARQRYAENKIEQEALNLISQGQIQEGREKLQRFQLSTPLGRFRYKQTAVQAGAAAQVVVAQVRSIIDVLEGNNGVKSTLAALLTSGVRFPAGFLKKELHITPTYAAHSRFNFRRQKRLGQQPAFFTKYKKAKRPKPHTKHLNAALVGWFLGDNAGAVINDGALAHLVAREYSFLEGGDEDSLTHVASGAATKTVSLDYKHKEVEQLLHARYPSLLRRVAEVDPAVQSFLQKAGVTDGADGFRSGSDSESSNSDTSENEFKMSAAKTDKFAKFQKDVYSAVWRAKQPNFDPDEEFNSRLAEARQAYTAQLAKKKMRGSSGSSSAWKRLSGQCEDRKRLNQQSTCLTPVHIPSPSMRKSSGRHSRIAKFATPE